MSSGRTHDVVVCRPLVHITGTKAPSPADPLPRLGSHDSAHATQIAYTVMVTLPAEPNETIVPRHEPVVAGKLAVT